MSERMLKARKAIHGNLLGLSFLIFIFVLCIVNAQRIADYWIYDKMEYTLWIEGTGDSIETDYISNFWNKTEFVNFNGAIRNALGQPEMNGVVKLNNGYLLTTSPRRYDSDINARVEALYELDQHLQSKDIPMLFTLVPYTSSKYDPQLPIGVEDYGNDNMDRFARGDA